MVVGIVSVGTNGYVLHDIYKKREYINPTNTFNLFLASAEMLYGLVCCPLLIVLAVTQDFSFVTCLGMNNTVNIFTNISAIMLLCTIGERFVNMRYHFSYNRVVQPQCIASLLLGVSALCFLFGMVPYIWRVEDETHKWCLIAEVIRGTFLFIFNIVFVIITSGLIISLVIMIVKCNKDKNLPDDEEKNLNYRRSTTIFEGRKCNPNHPCVLMLIFLLLIFPLQVLDTLTFWGHLDDLPPWTAGAVMKTNNVLNHLNALVSPFIYDSRDPKGMASKKNSEVDGSPRKETVGSPSVVSATSATSQVSHYVFRSEHLINLLSLIATLTNHLFYIYEIIYVIQ